VAEMISLNVLAAAFTAEQITLLVQVGCDLSRLRHISDGHDGARAIVERGRDGRARAQDVNDYDGAILYIVLREDGSSQDYLDFHSFGRGLLLVSAFHGVDFDE